MSHSNNILILGSKKGSKLPNIQVDKIYSANGAAERALHYKKIVSKYTSYSFSGGKVFFRV